MKKLVGLIILGLLGFYVGWPAWSGYRISTAVAGKDAATLATKVDFPAVRESMRPVVSVAVERELDAQMKQAGGAFGNLLGGDLKKQMLPQLVDGVLTTLVTPENVIRIASEGDAAGSVRRILAEKMGDIAGKLPVMPGASGGSGGLPVPGLPAAGGLGQLGDLAKQMGVGGRSTVPTPQQAPQPAPAPAAAGGSVRQTSFGFGNIKGFGFDGPLGFAVSVARDAAQTVPDLTAGMSFTGGDWKITKIVPRL
jgi:hypothetical protein